MVNNVPPIDPTGGGWSAALFLLLLGAAILIYRRLLRNLDRTPGTGNWTFLVAMVAAFAAAYAVSYYCETDAMRECSSSPTGRCGLLGSASWDAADRGLAVVMLVCLMVIAALLVLLVVGWLLTEIRRLVLCGRAQEGAVPPADGDAVDGGSAPTGSHDELA
jgi:peptidoglycan/LPS O-acetylase OafA/YrhL